MSGGGNGNHSIMSFRFIRCDKDKKVTSYWGKMSLLKVCELLFLH